MRITGGQARGITLRVPNGDAVRPATDGLRQSVFSSLAPRLAGARFADLFAGSGAYGLEALSRGAAKGLFVEKNAKTAALLRQNLEAVAKSLKKRPNELGAVLNMDALSAPLGGEGLPELVFIDPPWDHIEELAPRLFEKLSQDLAGVGDPLIIFEMPGELEVKVPGWDAVKRLGSKGARQPSAVFYRKTSP